MPLELVYETPAQRKARGDVGKERESQARATEVVSFDGEGRLVICHLAGRLPEIADAVVNSIADSDAGVFASSSGLVRVHTARETKNSSVSRPKGALTLHSVDATHLAEVAGRVAKHQKFDARAKGLVPCDCPRRVAETVLARGQWDALDYLNGFVESPTITPSGRVVDRPGYDEETGLFNPGNSNIEGYVSPPENPSFDDAKYAAEYLVSVFDTFDLVSESDRSAAVAGILTALVRRVIPAAPMFAVTAPTAGTGKTLLAETFAIVSTCRRSSVLSLGHDDSEAEKRLGGVLLAGDAVILLDNIERPLGGDLLCQVTTQPSIRMRPLGSSGMVSVPTHALIVATGNNLAIIGDLKRRVVLIRLDAKVERPELRQFAESHIDKVFRDRGSIITAALTVIKAYLATQAPSVEGIAPFGSFEEWDRMVRRPLCWLGLADPLNASEGLRSQDPDIEAMRLLFAAWRDVYADKAVSVSDLVRDGMAYGSAMNGEHDLPELYAALQLVCREKVNSGRAGYWLRAHRDRIVDGMKLEQVEVDRKGIARWRVVA